ncbi:hypothetical protein DFH07DRAFT_770429 [Mycena maculata]|uniref:Uncharacterized protein n=1 Tax=Mycena maculata TaxID=230809 RepID=A0AAD7JGX0_9AGAR|nr:hypothetical protein DFH07DRAFT_770429 [Mycena maculata]
MIPNLPAAQILERLLAHESLYHNLRYSDIQRFFELTYRLWPEIRGVQMGIVGDAVIVPGAVGVDVGSVDRPNDWPLSLPAPVCDLLASVLQLDTSLIQLTWHAFGDIAEAAYNGPPQPSVDNIFRIHGRTQKLGAEPLRPPITSCLKCQHGLGKESIVEGRLYTLHRGILPIFSKSLYCRREVQPVTLELDLPKSSIRRRQARSRSLPSENMAAVEVSRPVQEAVACGQKAMIYSLFQNPEQTTTTKGYKDNTSQYTNKFYKDYPRYINSVRSLRNERARKQNGPRKPGARGWAGGVGRVGMGARGMHHGDGLCRKCAAPGEGDVSGQGNKKKKKISPQHLRRWARGDGCWMRGVGRAGFGVRGWPRGVWRVRLAAGGLACGVGPAGFGARGWPRGVGRAGLAAELGVRAGMGVWAPCSRAMEGVGVSKGRRWRSCTCKISGVWLCCERAAPGEGAQRARK